MSDLLHTLNRMDRTKVFLVALVVGLITLFIPGFFGGILLLAVVAGMAMLMRHTWRVTAPRALVIRLLILGILAGFALSKIF